MRLLVVGDFQSVFPSKLKKRLSQEEFDTVIGVGDYAGLKEWRPLIMHNLRAAQQGNPLLSANAFFGKRKYKMLLHKEEAAAKSILKTLDSFEKPFLLVFGNGDDEWYCYPFASLWPTSKRKRKFLQRFCHARDITYGKRKIGNIWFVGFGGYMDIDAYFNRALWKQDSYERHFKRCKRRRKSREKLFSLLKRTKGERIFVFHYPPKGAFDIIKDKKDNPMNGKSAGIGFFSEAIKKYKPRLVLCGHMHEYQGMKNLYGVPVINPGDAEKGKYAVVEIPEDKKGKIKVKFVH